MQGLGDLAGGAVDSLAFSTSADGSVIVGKSVSATGDQAFLWDAVNGMRALDDVLVTDFGLDLTGWTLTTARGVSDDGLVIAGTGIHNGNTEAFIVNLRQDQVAVPAPGMIALFGFGLAWIGLSRRRRVV